MRPRKRSDGAPVLVINFLWAKIPKTLKMKHLLSLEKLPARTLKNPARRRRVQARAGAARPEAAGRQTWALMFSKSSTRTRVSFEVGIRELGGQTMFFSTRTTFSLGRGEPIKDTARVLGRMIHGAVIRTFAQGDVEEFAEFSGIPTINALTDDEHPCQILADIFTFKEKRGPIAGKVVTFIGDGACNVPRRGFLRRQNSALNCASPRRKNSSRPPKF
jgi:ornithine carbamoyltransferase